MVATCCTTRAGGVIVNPAASTAALMVTARGHGEWDGPKQSKLLSNLDQILWGRNVLLQDNELDRVMKEGTMATAH